MQDIHASTTNISMPGEVGEDEDVAEGGAGLTVADSSGNLIVKRPNKSLPKKPKKGKRKGLSDGIDLISYAPSKKHKGRYVIGEKVGIPHEIMEYIYSNFENGVDALTPDLAMEIVQTLYVKP